MAQHRGVLRPTVDDAGMVYARHGPRRSGGSSRAVEHTVGVKNNVPTDEPAADRAVTRRL
jgi:hypothetical protein